MCTARVSPLRYRDQSASTSGTASITYRPCSAADTSTRCPTIVASVEPLSKPTPREAVRQILRLKRGLEAWSTRSLDETIRVTSMISPSGAAVTGWSTLARELAFVVSHTIHHQAIIGVAPGHSRPRGARPVWPLAVNAAAELRSPGRVHRDDRASRRWISSGLQPR